MPVQVDLRSRANNLDIAEVARQSGVPASTLRFYEEKGLIASTGRRGQRRQFDPSVLERLALIALGRTAGFSLEEIALMFAPDGRPRIDRQMLAAKADELDRTIRKLTAIRAGLQHAVACPAPSHMECPTFRRILKATVSRARETGDASGAPDARRGKLDKSAAARPRPRKAPPSRSRRRARDGRLE